MWTLYVLLPIMDVSTEKAWLKTPTVHYSGKSPIGNLSTPVCLKMLPTIKCKTVNHQWRLQLDQLVEERFFLAASFASSLSPHYAVHDHQES